MRHHRSPSIVRSLTLVAASIAILFLVSNCGGSSSPTDPEAASNPVGSTGGSGNTSNTDGSGGTGDTGTSSGTLVIQMIDDPTEEICELWVYIRDIRVKPDQESPVLLGTGIGLYELLALQDGPPATLGDWVIDQGTYQFIEMLLDEDESSVIEKDPVNSCCPGDPETPDCELIESPLQIPSEKFKVNGGPFTVSTDTTVTIDFEANNSLKRKGSAKNPKGWQLKPKVSIVGVDQD